MKKFEMKCELCGKTFFASRKSEMARRRFCSRSCRAKVISKRKHTEEEKLKISMSHIGKKCPWNTARNKKYAKKGSESANWRGGISTQNNIIRSSLEYKLWREAVFKRDRWTCIWCGYKGHNIHADHIQEFYLYPELRLAIDNGRTLCKECHYKRHKKI